MGEKYRALVLSGKDKVAVETREMLPLQEGEVRVRLGAGGICGSDLHYYHDYGNVGFPLRNPVVMGHEASGSIVEVGPGVKNLAVGDKVSVNPVRNCGHCMACRRGNANNCENKRFPGSAMNYPHIDGLFREYFEWPAYDCVKVSPDTDLAKLAFVEPFACSMHAVQQAGNIVGAKVLVTGSGPIGVLAAAAAKACGAGQVVITDVVDGPLEIARKMGADIGLNTAATPLEKFIEGNGFMDVSVDASGAVPAIASCLNSLRKGGTMVQLGTAPSAPFLVPWILLQAREIRVFGSNQFNTEFDICAQLILNGSVDPTPMLTRQFAFEEADAAFAAAGDRRNYMKVQFIP